MVNCKRAKDAIFVRPDVSSRGLIKSLGKFELTLRRYGKPYAEKKFAITRGGIFVERPGERFETDEWQIDMQTLIVDWDMWQELTAEEREAVKRLRMTLTVVMDVATRCIAGPEVQRPVSRRSKTRLPR